MSNMKTIVIPTYIFDAALRHYERIVEKGRWYGNDTRTANAFRMARQDIKKLKKLKDKQHGKR